MYKKFLLVSVVLVLTTIVSVLFSRSEIFTAPPSAEEKIGQDIEMLRNTDVENISQTIKNLTKHNGHEYTFSLMREVEKQDDASILKGLSMHDLAHVVADVIYDEYGFAGLSYCTDEFNYGCNHMIMADLIYENGDHINDFIIELCNESSLSMEDCDVEFGHGIGHGLVALNSYDVFKALDVCQNLFPLKSDGMDNCAAGVFMEYDLLTMVDVTETTYRDIEPGEELYPCELVIDEYQSECYDYQSKIWLRKFGTSNTKFLNELCNRIENQADRNLCQERIEGKR